MPSAGARTPLKKLHARIFYGARNKISKVVDGPAIAGLASVKAETIGGLAFSFSTWTLGVQRWALMADHTASDLYVVAEFRNLSGNPYRHTPRPPSTWQVLEATWNSVATRATLSVFEIPFPKLVPIALD